MTRLVTILALSILLASGFGFPGKKVKRGFKDVFTVVQGDRGNDEQNASVNDEGGTGCSDIVESNEDNSSRELSYNRDTSLEDQKGGRSYSKSSATSSASASSTSYNLKNQNNIIPK